MHVQDERTIEPSGLICPCCAPALVADGSADISVLPCGWAVRGNAPPIRCACGEQAHVRDWLEDRSWCTDCWVGEACRRDAEWEALEI